MFMTARITIVSIIAPLSLYCCALVQPNPGYVNWDSSNDERLTRNEFVRGYIRSNYFFKWSKNRAALSIDAFQDSLFRFMDTNDDRQLTEEEFASRITFYSQGIFEGDFHTWDSDGNSCLTLREFKNSAGRKLTPLWDTTADHQITEKEIALGMFQVCDANSDDEVDAVELGIWLANRG